MPIFTGFASILGTGMIGWEIRDFHSFRAVEAETATKAAQLFGERLAHRYHPNHQTYCHVGSNYNSKDKENYIGEVWFGRTDDRATFANGGKRSAEMTVMLKIGKISHSRGRSRYIPEYVTKGDPGTLKYQLSYNKAEAAKAAKREERENYWRNRHNRRWR